MGWFHDKYGEDAHPILPIDLYAKLYENWHGDADAVNDVVDRVQQGQLSVDDVQKAIDRPDISPEDWRDFEDGWRPDNW